jgi:hypothetical protein
MNSPYPDKPMINNYSSVLTSVNSIKKGLESCCGLQTLIKYMVPKAGLHI